MSALEMSHGDVDLEEGVGHHHGRSSAGSDVSAEGSVCFSDADEESCYSQFYSTTRGSCDDSMFASVSDGEIGNGWGSRRASSVSGRSVVVEHENKVHLGKVERDCRICHLGLESNSRESGAPLELGCSCKDDLAAAHKHCAETWFKIKGNRTCEICHSLARNVAGVTEMETVEQSSNENNSSTVVFASIPSSDTRSIWHGHRFLNFLLACMVFAFVISWLFHFNVPASS